MKTRTKITVRDFVGDKVNTKELDVQNTYHMVVRKMNTIGDYMEVLLKSGRLLIEKSMVLLVEEIETTKTTVFSEEEEGN